MHGFLSLSNAAAKPVEVQAARLIEPRGLEADEAFVLRTTNSRLVGFGAGAFGPGSPGGPGYAERARIPGARIPSRDTTADFNLVLNLSLTQRDAPGGAEGVELTYLSNGRRFVWRSPLKLQIEPVGGTCS